VISLTSAGRIQVTDRKKKTHAHGFEIPTPARTFYLCAENETDKLSWIEALEQAKDTISKKRAKVCLQFYLK
jgi:hypothetical protein